MESWIAPAVPLLPDRGPQLSLYDAARGAVLPAAADGPRTMYVCGITPYDATHLGHAATMITFDLVNRYWRDRGYPVTYVQNVTDIDDPLLERAERDGEDWVVLGMRETALFREDMEALRVLPPEHYVGAVETIPSIVARVEGLLASGAAYRLEDGSGDVYFAISAAPRFGYESHLSREQMVPIFAERGGDPARAGKADPLDPLLWRGIRPGEPSWDGGSLGPGRPGWHIECAVIALSLLGSNISVQGGGNDLIYPHHECSAAHAEVLSGSAPFAEFYVHAGMIGLDGEKMSKSRGNLVFVSRRRADGVDPMALRLALIAGHYRADRSWTDDLLKTAERRLSLWRAAAALPSAPSAVPLLGAVRSALASDLDTPQALALVDSWADASLGGSSPESTVELDPAAPALMSSLVDALLGIRLLH